MSTIGERLAKVMADVEAVGKTRRNTQQGYSFRGIDDFSNALHPILAKHGVVLRPCVQECKTLESTSTKSGGIMFRVQVTLDLGFVAPDQSAHVVRTVAEGCDTGDKATNKAMSAALKYALSMTFLIPTEELVDSEVDHHEAHRRPEPARVFEVNRDNMAVRKALLRKRVAALPGSRSQAAILASLDLFDADRLRDAEAWVSKTEAEVARIASQKPSTVSEQKAAEAKPEGPPGGGMFDPDLVQELEGPEPEKPSPEQMALMDEAQQVRDQQLAAKAEAEQAAVMDKARAAAEETLKVALGSTERLDKLDVGKKAKGPKAGTKAVLKPKAETTVAQPGLMGMPGVDMSREGNW